jgi:hypothetical protein
MAPALDLNKLQRVGSSPYSFDSRDALLRPPAQMSPTGRNRELPPIPSAVDVTSRDTQYSLPRHLTTQASQESFVPSRRSGMSSAQSPSPVPDEDARLLAESVKASQNGLQRVREKMENGHSRTVDSRPRSPPNTTLLTRSPGTEVNFNGREAPQEISEDTDIALLENAQVAAQWEEVAKAKPPAASGSSPNKVMTPAQFERYRQQQDMERNRQADSSDASSDDGSDTYEDHDDAERDREAAKQRRKQEAHLAVYRQSMMKVTGEQAPAQPVSGMDGSGSRVVSMSSPNLMNRLSSVTMDTKPTGPTTGGDGEEEDEDVPLGILAAHGFPSKNRPPTRLSSQGLNPSIRAPPVAGESRPGQGGNLPVFARNLPKDPYYGASLVNPANRESLAMGGGAPVQGLPAGTTPPNLHPSGLVGVIAGEERARNLRRGSPNGQGFYDIPGTAPQHPSMARSQTMMNLPTMGSSMMGPGMVPGMALPLTPGDQAQIQIAQQMRQMMEMQMQWMQQMTQMQHVNNQAMSPQLGQQSSSTPNLLAPPTQMQRPLSMPMKMAPTAGQRTMSTLSPQTAPWHRPPSFAPTMNGAPGQGYAHSIAPSERSNVGLAPRYRPVSMAPLPSNPAISKRSSTFTTSSYQPWPTNDGEIGKHSPNSTIRALATPGAGKKPASKAADDEDDDQGWAEMSRKRDKKKSTWKTKKAHTGLQEFQAFFNGEPHAAL